MTYPTSANLKTYLGVSGASEDTLLGWIIDAAVAWVEAFTGHDFVKDDAVTITVLPEYPNLLGKSRRKLLITQYDLHSVTSITNGDGETVDSGDYRLLPTDGPPYFMIELTADSGLFWWRGWESGVVTIVGSVGYSEACPDDVFLAILELGAYFYRTRSTGAGGPVTTATRQGLVIPAEDVPENIKAKLYPYARARA